MIYFDGKDDEMLSIIVVFLTRLAKTFVCLLNAVICFYYLCTLIIIKRKCTFLTRYYNTILGRA